MKKLISCLLAVMLLFSMAGAFAKTVQPIEKSNVLKQFLKETDRSTKDIALQVQLGDRVSDLVIRPEGNSLHLVARDDGTQTGHLQLTPEALYLSADGVATKLQYATVASFMQGLVKDIDAMVTEAMNSLPEQEVPSEEELKAAAAKAAIVASVAAAQAKADNVTLLSAAASFASKFKPEYILEWKKDDSSVEISLRSEAFAAALAEAVDDLMLDPALAELVDRRAAVNGSATFADMQKDWLVNREATLAAIRTMQMSERIDESGHWKSHFQIGEKTEGAEDGEVLICDSDTWINDEGTAAEMVFSLGFEGKEPIEVFEMAVSPHYLWERLTAQQKTAEFQFDIADGRVVGGILTIENDGEEVKTEFGQDYLYMKGPKGGISTTVRETWTGKIRYELIAETAEGEEASLTIDFYKEDDSLICELKTGESDASLMFKLSRIDRIAMEDLSASKAINEITADMIKAELEDVLTALLPTETAAAEAGN